MKKLAKNDIKMMVKNSMCAISSEQNKIIKGYKD